MGLWQKSAVVDIMAVGQLQLLSEPHMEKQRLLASRSWIHQEGGDGVAWEKRAHRLQHPWQPIEPRGDCEIMMHGWARWDLTQLPCLHLGAEGRRRWRRSS